MSGYDGEGNLVFWHEFTYNLQGQRASVAKYNAQGVQEQYLELACDEEGRSLIDYIYATYEGDLTKQTIEYSENGYWQQRQFYNSDDTPTDYIENTYDDKGNRTEARYCNGDGTLRSYTEYTYDDEGNWTGQREYDVNGVLQFEQKFQ